MSKQYPLVMVVEDEKSLLEAISKKLSSKGISTVRCSTGQEAFDYLASNSELPDVIWLDYLLPDMDGLTFMAKITENHAWENIPIMVVSNSASADKVNAMLSQGARRYFLKASHTLEEIVDTAKKFIDNDEKEHV